MRCPTLAELPPPPPGKTGWPWTEESEQLPDKMPAQPEVEGMAEDGSSSVVRRSSDAVHRPSSVSWPRISIVTPSYNQGQFIEETIRSVLLQGYPNLEYMVIDGGSDDGSVEIIKKYEPWLAYWVSEPDRGQSHAINKGWKRANGDLIAYLCSDDTYLENALKTVGLACAQNPRMVAYVGGILGIDENSASLSSGSMPCLPKAAPLDLSIIDHAKWYLPQPSGFFKRAKLNEQGCFVREDLKYTLDRELYYRLCRSGSVMLLDKVLATYRFHDDSKTVSQLLDMHAEAPKALAYCTNGGIGAHLRRWLVGRYRIGEGHLKYARKGAERCGTKLKHFFLAVWYRPVYLFNKFYWKACARSLGIAGPLKRFRDQVL